MNPSPSPIPGGGPPAKPPAPPRVPDHELIRRIGRGAYGEVWLARCTLGTYRAVKIVHRASFDHDRPFEREFEGICKFEPVSRTHDSQVDILHVGRGDDCFYYVMELADDQATGGQINPDNYTARTLKSDLQFHGRLPFEECVRIGIALTTALEHLHENGLVHRDVKPSNIIFVNGVPKLADIGLVTGVDATRSFVGTEGFAAPEGAGTPQADVFSLGKVIYEAATGKDRQEFPELPTQLRELPEREGMMELNAVIAKACRHDPKDRYASATAMRADLDLLQSGKSLARLHRTEKRLRFVQRAGAAVTAVAAVIAAGWLWQARQTDKVRELAAENLTLAERSKANAALAVKNELAARERLYAADINLAQQALQADNLRLARSLLQNHVPPPGQPDLRGFEWRYLWQKCRSKELFSLPGHTNQSRVLAFSPDGERIAVGGFFGTTMILNLGTRQRIAVLPGTNYIQSVEFSPDGKLLAIASHLDVRLWDARTFSLVRELPDAVAPALFSRDGRHLLTYRKPPSGKREDPLEEDWRLDVWDTDTWSASNSLQLPVSGSRSFSRDLYVQPVFAVDGKQLVVLAGDTIRVFSFPDLRETLVVPEKIPAGIATRPFLALAPDNRTLATVIPEGFGVRLWDLEDNRELRVLPGHVDHVFSADFSPDGKVLATGSGDQTTKLWNVATGELLNTLRGQGDEVIALAFSPDGKRLASLGTADAVVKLWDSTTRARRDTIRRPLWPVGFDADGSLVSFLSPERVPVVVDPADFQLTPMNAPIPRTDANYGLYLGSVSVDGRLQGLWGDNGDGLKRDVMEVWDRRLGTLLCSVPALSPLISFAPKKAIITTSTTNQAGVFNTTVWQLPSGSAKWVFTNQFASDLISPDEQYLLANEGEHFRLWRVEGEELVSVRTAQHPVDRFVSGTAFSPDGRLLATSARDIFLWSLPSLEVVGVLKGHTRAGTQIAFSPDGRTLASIADDRTVRLWHVSTQRELIRFQTSEQDQGHFQVEFSPDGRALATHRSDTQGPITWLHYAPSFAEIAVAEGGDYRTLAGEDAATWLNVAKALQRENRWAEALEACNEVLRRTVDREDLAWLRDKARPLRVTVLKQLNRLDEAGAENCALMGIPPRKPSAPPEAIDLSAFYNASLANPPQPGIAANDLSELPTGVQKFAGTVFDVRGKLHIIGPSPDREWRTDPQSIDGIPVQRRLNRLHFLQAAGYQSKDIPLGERIGCFRVHFANGTAVEISLGYNQNTSDWWELDHLPRKLPEAQPAWHGASPPSRARSQTLRLFKLTWENPLPEVEITTLDFVAQHPKTHPFLIALTAE